MLQVNLLPWRDLQRQSRLRFYLKLNLLPLMFLLPAMLCAAFFIRLQMDTARHALDALRSCQTALMRQQEKVQRSTRELHQLQQLGEQQQQRYLNSQRYPALLQWLAQNTPEGMWLLELRLDAQGVLTLRGESATYQHIMALNRAFNEDSQFQSATLRDILQQSAGSLNFTLLAQLSGLSGESLRHE